MTELNKDPAELLDAHTELSEFESTAVTNSGDSAFVNGRDAVAATPAKLRTRAEKVRGMLAAGSLGLLAVGGAFAVMENPIDEMKDDVVQAAPWAGGAIVASEAMWILGASMALGATGKKIGNPLRVRRRVDAEGIWSETDETVFNSAAFRAGLRINTIGAIGTAGAIAGGAFTALPAETWPGAVGLAAADIAGTLALRAPLYNGVHQAAKAEKQKKVTVRHATLDDIDRLADIDLELFNQAYGEAAPKKDEVVEMLTARWHNAKGWMFVAEQNGQVEGFVTAFRTNKSAEDFESWEESTAGGTLAGKVDPKGKYVYVANMTIRHDAVVEGAKDMLLANLFANAIHGGGVEYGYWESRMPQFKEWLDTSGIEIQSAEQLDKIANEYATMTREDGKRYDWQLRMYEADGFKLKRLAANAFNDEASMNYGAVFSVPCPPNSPTMRRIAPIRKAYANALRLIAKKPKLLAKVV